MSHEKITDLMQQWLAAWNRADRAALEQLAHETYTPDCVIHDAGLPNDIRGPEALMAYYGPMVAQLNNARFVYDDLIFQGDMMAIHLSVHPAVPEPQAGSTAGDTPKTGTQMSICRLVGDQIAEEWDVTIF